MPSGGIGPKPKINSGESGTKASAPAQITSAGTSILPVPRITLARPFITHSSTLPPNTTLE